MSKTYFEVVIGNGYEKDAIKILKKRKNLRIIDSSKIKLENINGIVSNFNSLLIQSPDNKKFESKNFQVVSKKQPSSKIFRELIFALNVCRNVKSNAIVLTSNTRTVGIGSGQPSPR